MPQLLAAPAGAKLGGAALLAALAGLVACPPAEASAMFGSLNQAAFIPGGTCSRCHRYCSDQPCHCNGCTTLRPTPSARIRPLASHTVCWPPCHPPAPPAGLVGDSPLREGFVQAFLLILFSEIGDKTFFIAVLLALQQSKSSVFAGTFGALAVMTVISGERAETGRDFHGPALLTILQLLAVMTVISGERAEAGRGLHGPWLITNLQWITILQLLAVMTVISGEFCLA